MVVGSEIVVLGYAVIAFLSLYFFNSLSQGSPSTRVTTPRGDDVDPLDSRRDFTETEIDPMTFAFKFLCVAVFFISLIGMGNAVMESYDYCNVLPVNQTTVGNLTTLDYSHTCFDNTNSEGLNFYKFVFFIAQIAGLILLIAMIWQLFLFVKRKLWDRIRGFFKGRR